MGKVIETMTAFKAGELSPYLVIRTDIPDYKDGAKILRNVIIWPHGGITKRAGTEFILEANDV